MNLVETWEVRLHSDDGEELILSSYDSEDKAAKVANVINYDCSSDFKGEKTDKSYCLRRIKGAVICRVRSYTFDGIND